jgi:hypothetical protein
MIFTITQKNNTKEYPKQDETSRRVSPFFGSDPMMRKERTGDEKYRKRTLMRRDG